MILWKWGIYFKLYHYKSIESEITYHKEWNWFELHLDFTRKCDHAGISFYLEIMGINLSIKLYDSRHWNYDEDRWYKPGEPSAYY